MIYKRDDFTGFEFDLFGINFEFVFLRNFPITIALSGDRKRKLICRPLDIGHLFYD